MSKKISINIQGLSRRDAEQQRCFVADEGRIFVFNDLNSAEPTVLAHYSQDPNYLNATLHMVGKKPYYASNGTLMINDPYLMVASRFPLWKEFIADVFNSKDYPEGVSGFDCWTVDKKKVLEKIGSIRDSAKMWGLALVYGMGVKRMVLAAQMEKKDLSLEDAKAFKKVFWATFPLAKRLGEKLIVQYNSLGYILNDFGYALYPEAEYKCMNALIQSTVSGIMDFFNYLFFTKCQEAEFVTIIHDENCMQIPIAKEEEIKRIFYECQDEMNRQLGWSVPVTFGWKTSRTFEIK